MDIFEQAFRLLPDTVIITDAYWYILDYNRAEPFEKLKKGTNLARYMPNCRDLPNDRFVYGGKVFQRSTTPVFEKDLRVGYAVYLVDITDREALIEQQSRKSAELEAMTQAQARANAELEAYVRQAEALSVYEEQLRIARAIHDDAGHAVTALNTISQMCLQIGSGDPAQYDRLIGEGLTLCEKATRAQAAPRRASLRETLEALRDGSPFPIELAIEGEEPAFAGALRETVEKVCQEAYHNTLAHSMADKLFIEARMAPDALSLRIRDNGSFRGALEKGFGLTMMEESIRASGGEVRFEAREGEGFGISAEWRAAQ